MTDERKLSSIKVVFTNGTAEVFKNVENIKLDDQSISMAIADHTYYTRVFLDKILYVEEIIDDNSVTYYADDITYTMREEETHD